MDSASDSAPAPTLSLPRAASSPRAARDFVRHHCLSAGIDDDLRDTVVLLTSEVVTNAVLHADSEAHVTVTSGSNKLRVEVRDQSTETPGPIDHDLDALYGRGLALVDTLAANWGTRVEEDGKIVWFEVTAEPRDKA